MKTGIFRTLSSVALGLMVLASNAQEMGPPAELKVLEPMLGSWTGKLDYDMMGEKGAMDIKITYSWEGMMLKGVQDYTMGEFKMNETSFTFWNDKTKKVTTHFYATFAPTPRIETLSMKGQSQVWLGEPWTVAPGMDVIGRATITVNPDKTTMDYLLEFQEGDKWNKVIWGVLKKAPAASK